MAAAQGQEEGLRGRKRQRTREAIIRCGIELFAERGLKDTTIPDIAAAADIAPRTFFSYFPRKEDLLFEEQRQGARDLREVLETRQPDERTVDVLARMMPRLWELPPPEVLRLRKLRYQIIGAETRLQGPDHSEYADAIREPLLASYARDLRRARVKDSKTYARLLTGLTIGLMMELVYVARESVIRGTREKDVAYLRAVGQAAIRTLSGAYEVIATRHTDMA